jgi:uncharacterized protein involved in type VI secretion and phage assembly
MKMEGVTTAFVREVDPEQGRVKVAYSAREERLLSPWAPIAAFMSGGRRGALFMPEPGDEVLVGFADGQFEHPYVLGFLWNGEHKSPETTKDNRVIVTPGGHQLRFEDKAGDKRVVLKTEANRHVTLDDKAGTARIEIKSSDHTITLDDTAKKISIQAGQGVGVTITLNTQPASLSIAIGAGHTIDVGPSGMTLNTTGVVNINCSSANVTATGTTNLTTPVLNVSGGMANFTGVVTATTVIASSIVCPVYTPGVGNLL